MPKFVSDILAKAGLTVDGVVTLNNTATAQTPLANDNSTKLATTAWVTDFVTSQSGVTSFNTRTGTITLSGTDVTTALTYTPANDSLVVHIDGTETITGLKSFSSNVLIGTTTDITSSILTMNSTSKGFLPPRMTAAERAAISSPATGLIVYQTDGTEGLYIKLALGWKTLAIV